MRNKKKTLDTFRKRLCAAKVLAATKTLIGPVATLTKPKSSIVVKLTDIATPLSQKRVQTWRRISLESPRFAVRNLINQNRLRVVTQADVQQLRRQGYHVSLLRRIPSSSILASAYQPTDIWTRAAYYHRTSIGPNLGMKATFDENSPEFSFCGSDNPIHGKLLSAGFPSATPGKKSSKKERVKKLWLAIVSIEKELRSLQEEMDEEDGDGNDGTPPPTGLFKAGIREQDLSDCFYQIYDHFYGKDRTEMLCGQFSKDIDFVALLYVLVNDYKLGSEKLAVKPFHAFIRSTVLLELKPCHRTLYNRLNVQFKSLMECAKTRQGIPVEKRKFKCEEEKNYMQVRAVFCNTKFFKDHNKLLKKIS